MFLNSVLIGLYLTRLRRSQSTPGCGLRPRPAGLRSGRRGSRLRGLPVPMRGLPAPARVPPARGPLLPAVLHAATSRAA